MVNPNNITQNNNNDKSFDKDKLYSKKNKTQKKLEDNLENVFSFGNIINSLSKLNNIENISGFNLFTNIKIAEGGTMEILYGTTNKCEKEVAIKIPKKKIL